MAGQAMVLLPEGTEHGTPEGFAAGCRKEKYCPALYEHGMACLYAHLRSMNDVRYFKAKVRDARPAAIARALGFTADRAIAEVTDADVAEERRVRDREPRAAAQPTSRVTPRAPQPIPTPQPVEAPDMIATPDAIDQTAIDVGSPTPPAEAGVPEPAADTATAAPDTTVPTPDAIAPEVDIAPATPTAQKAAKKPRKPPTQAPGSGRSKAELALIRIWARENGHQVSDKGRISLKIVDLYDARPPLDFRPREDDRTCVICADESGYLGSDNVCDGCRAELPAPEAPLDFGHRSDQLDETRDRINPDRPEWATVTVHQDVEHLRGIIVALEQELHHETELRTTAETALAFTLHKWAETKTALAESGRHHLEHVAITGLDRLLIDELEKQLLDERRAHAVTKVRLGWANLARDVAAAAAETRTLTEERPARRVWWKRSPR